MRTFTSPLLSLLTVFVLSTLASLSFAFVPTTTLNKPSFTMPNKKMASMTSVSMGFGLGDEEPKKLTRENEPEEYFATNLDKLSDEEKIPIAIAGFAFISLPFIAGLIALYASK